MSVETPQYVSDIKFWSTSQVGQGPEARGTLTVGDAVRINFAVWRGKENSLRLALPVSENKRFDSAQEVSDKNRKFFDEVSCVSKERRDELEAYVFEKLLAERNKASNSDGFSDPPF